MSDTLRQRKADRFERVAKKEIKAPWVMNEARLAMILRREHQAVVRMVRAVGLQQAAGKGLMGDKDAIDTILTRLNARAR